MDIIIIIIYHNNSIDNQTTKYTTWEVTLIIQK